MRRPSQLSLVVAALGVALACGCSTYEHRLQDVRRHFHAGNLELAQRSIDEAMKRKFSGEEDVLKLEQAVVDLAAGKPKEAEAKLREVRDRFDYLEQSSLGETALSMLTDANGKAYPGEDHEKVLVRAMLAISNLMADGGDAGAYSLQVTDKQQQIIEAAREKDGENLKQGYKQLALAPYIHGLLRESTHTNYDDAARANAMVCSWQPGFRYGPQDLDRVRRGQHSAPGHGVLYVFCFVGRGPYKQETIEIPSTVALLIADRIISNNAKYTLPPNIAPIKVPKLVLTSNAVQGVRVAVDRVLAGDTATIADVGAIALEQYEAVLPKIVAEAVVRRIVKKGVIYGSKEVLGVERGGVANIGLDVLGVVWEASEAADTRCWGLLPDKIQVLRLELPEGDHQIGLAPITGTGISVNEVVQAVPIANGRNTYMLANFPDMRLAGKVLVNQP